ncbi:MAG: BamA/TamA family outer membrane protein [Phaeodactylibacter sp.]|nr:BamA/TamA family outer membrane protein [Phaeodactylibacter sp.]MCB9274092.1 BamA/TamA family outer membrane protein [Lewinellaceae bacterium]
MRFIHPAKYIIGAIFALVFLTSCNTAKYLTGDEYLLKGNSIKLQGKGNIDRKRSLKYELSLLYKQKENSRFFFIPREWLYYKASGPEDTTKFDKWVRRVIAEPPAIYDPNLANSTVESMRYHLQYKGYFNAEAFSDIYVKQKRRKVYVTYYAIPGQQFTIDSVSFFSRDTVVNRILQNIAGNSYLKHGAGIDGKLYDRERERISKYMRNHGYANFFPNYIAPLEADTTRRPKAANLYLEVLLPPEDSVHQAFYVDDITVYMDYTPGKTDSLMHDSLANGILLRTPRPSFRIKPETILESIFLQKGQLFRQADYDKTNQQLSALGVFRFVRIKQEPDPDDPDKLDFRIELTQNKKLEVGMDFELNYANRSASGAGNLIGLTVGPSFRNRNLLKGAEQLHTDFSAGVEVNPSPNAIRDGRFWNTVDLRLQTELFLPRFVDNLGIWRFLNRAHIGKLNLFVSDDFYNAIRDKAATRFAASYNYLLILDFYEYNLFNGTFGFDFQRNSNQRLILNHIGIDYLAPITFEKFNDILKINDFLARSFGDQLFVSLLFRDLNFVYNARPNSRGNSSYLGLNMELSGAEVWAANSLYNSISGNDETFMLRLRGGKTVEFSQYLRTQVDLRQFHQFTPKRSVAARLAIGIARPYGFTSDVPYVKQFFAGGPNSIRAWAPRGLGPGAYEDPLSLDRRNNTRLYQTGDLSLEANLEYRFNIFWMVNGAFFLDAGNIWTLDRDTSRCGSQFLLRRQSYPCTDADGNTYTYTNEPFYRQIAIGGGFGLRLDFSYFILRLDMGVKLRHANPSPYVEGANNWKNYWFRDFRDDGGRTGLRAVDVINFNLGFGYPF